MNHASARRNNQAMLPQQAAMATSSASQGVIRTTPRQRPTPFIAHRLPSNQYPFGPQVPLRIATNRGRRNLSQSVVPAKDPVYSPPPVLSFLDATFRSYADRIQTELTQLRAVCTKVMFRERQEKEKWRAHCVTFKQERDAARERVRAMLKERESLRDVEAVLNSNNGEGSWQPRSTGARSLKRTRDGVSPVSIPGTDSAEPENLVRRPSPNPSSSAPSATTTVHSDSGLLLEEEEGVYTLLYPSPEDFAFQPFSISLSPISPSFPPHKRSRSADPVLCSVSAAGAAAPGVASPHLAHIPGPATHAPRRSSEGALADLKLPPILPARSGIRSSSAELPKLPVGITPPALFATTSTSTTSTSQRKPPAIQSPAPSPVWASPPLRPPAVLSAIPSVTLGPHDVHLDIMYVPNGGKLECRACRLLKFKALSADSSSAVLFPANAKREDLQDHCVKAHPQQCAEVAALKPADLAELRRRLYPVRP